MRKLVKALLVLLACNVGCLGLRAQSTGELKTASLEQLADSLFEAFEKENNRGAKADLALQLVAIHTGENQGSLVLNDEPQKLQTALKHLQEHQDELSKSQQIEALLLQPTSNGGWCETVQKVAALSSISRLDSVQKAIYYLLQYECKQSNNQLAESLQELKLAIQFLPKKANYLTLRCLLQVQLGHLYYHRLQLDSALYYYEECEARYDRIKHGNIHYQPGFGFIQDGAYQAKTSMNLGLVYDKLGLLQNAILQYEKAIAIFEKRGNRAGIIWGKKRLVNAFLDLHDYTSARSVLRSSIKVVESKTNEQGSGYLMLQSTLSEFNLEELHANFELVDSIMGLLDKPLRIRIKAGVFDLGKNSKFGQLKQLIRHIDLAMLLNGMHPIGRPKGLRPMLDSLKAMAEDFQKIENKNHSYQDAYLLLQSKIRIWETVLLAKNQIDQQTDELIKFFQNNHFEDWNYNVRMASWVFHEYGFYKQEIALLDLLRNDMESGGHKTELAKLYHQYAIAYQHANSYQEALQMRDKYDSMANEILVLNQHEQVARLNKKLEVAETKRQKAELEVQNKELEARRWRLRVGVGALIVVLALVLVAFYLNRARLINRRKRIEAENVLLQKDLKLKEDEMQRTTHELLRSNQSFTQLIGDIEKLTTDLTADNRKKARSVLIDHKAKAQEDIWRQFNLQFQSHYADFYKKLLDKCADLTQHEQRICAFHVSGLTNKEIEAITGQSLNSIYALKSKLRKKLQVENDESLTQFLEKVTLS